MMQTKGGNNYYQRNSISNNNHRQHGCCSHSSNVIHIMIICLLGTLMITFIIINQFQSSLFDNTPTYSSTVTMSSSMMIDKQQQRLDPASFSSNTKSSSSKVNYTTVFDKFKRNILMNHLNGPVDYNKYAGTMKVSKGFYKDSNTIIELNEHSYRSIHDTTNSGSDKGSSSSSSSSPHTHPYMIVFYASWCGHCKSFVKPYSLIVTDVISEVNQRNLNIYYSNEVSHRTRYFRKQYGSKHSSIDNSNGNDIGNGNGHGMDQVLIIYDTPVFAAINCVDYSSICEENKVTSYPTIIFYNFHNAAAVSRGGGEESNNKSTSSSSSSSSSSSIPSSDLIASSSNDPNQYRIEGGRVSAISKFIKGTLYSRSSMVMITRKEFVEKYGHLINTAAGSSADNGSSMAIASAEDTIGVVQLLSPPHISHTTTPDLRWHDSIASLLYMLSHELPADLEDNHQAKEALLGLLRTLLYLFPSRLGVGGGFNGLKSMLQQIVDIVDSNWKDSKLKDSIATDSNSAAGGDVVRVSIIKVINNFRNSGNIQQFQWMTCGVTSSSKQQQQQSSSSSLDSTTKSISSNKLRGAEVDGIVPVVKSIEARPHDDVGEGYTCGLWMLFHYLTVSSSVLKNIDSSGNSSENNITIYDVVHVIVDTVTHLFGCMDCRKHFIGDYEACKFDVCHLSVDDYSGLQLWLFHQHNSVTYRINAERHHQPINGFTKQSINLPVWPSGVSTECGACINSSSTSRNAHTRWSYDRSIFIDKHVLQYLKQSYSLA